MKNSFKKLIVLCLIVSSSILGFGGCRWNQDYIGPDYFEVIKNPTNFRIEYKCAERDEAEVRIENTVYFLRDPIIKILRKSDKREEREWCGAASEFCLYTSQYRKIRYEYKHIIYDEEEQYDTTFLGRQVTFFKWVHSVTTIDGDVNVDRREYLVDKENDVVLQYYSYLSRNGGEERQTIMFETTLFVVGGQSIPTI